MAVPAGVAAAAPAQSIRPTIANSAPFNLRCISLSTPAPTGAFEPGRARLPQRTDVSSRHVSWTAGPSPDLGLRLVAACLDNSNPVGRPGRCDDRQARLQSRDRFLQARCLSLTS